MKRFTFILVMYACIVCIQGQTNTNLKSDTIPVFIETTTLAEVDEIRDNQVLLKASRDVYLSRAAFDFSAAFFKVRGYDTKYGVVRLNGIPMNKMSTGRAQWSNWGGLNDVTRNQENSLGLEASLHGFGGILGTTNIKIQPTQFRPGLRISSSASNRGYSGRFMATYTDQTDEKWSYTVAASRRWATEGYIQGTLYDAYSLFGSLEYHWKLKHSLVLTSIFASNRRGRSAPITDEVFNLVGRQYNPHWGIQNGKIRNAREQKIQEPIGLLNYFYETNNLAITAGISYQFGKRQRSRLGFYNAPNTDPTYYRYLPSFYINSSIGANFTSANEAQQSFLRDPQIQWEQLYAANRNGSNNGKASFLLYNDTEADRQLSLNMKVNMRLNKNLKLDFGGTHQRLYTHNYAEISDLLGADFHEDIDTFSNTNNDTEGEINKNLGDFFNYRYAITANQTNAFSQLQFSNEKWHAFAAMEYRHRTYEREGFFRNDRFPENSLGPSSTVRFNNVGIKGGFRYKFSGRHWIAINGNYSARPPSIQNTFINPRENNTIVPTIPSEKVSSIDLNYTIRLPRLQGRFTAYHTRFQDATDINFFFVDSGVGSDFVQEAITNLDKLHFGVETGFSYKASSSVTLTGAAAYGDFSYANNPNITINFDTAGNEEDLINVEGTIDLGAANLKGYKLGQGPQTAISLGISYRDPKYWWLGTTVNFLGNNYINISSITRTQSFFLDPETGEAFQNITPDAVNQLLQQQQIEAFYVMNVIGGKSWKFSELYVSAFFSVSNVLDTIFKTGGFEQSRNGNFGELLQDNRSGTPSFAPKFWYGQGRTYFLNLAINF